MNERPEGFALGPCTPFFIVADLSRSLEHYLEGLGFECRFKAPDEAPFFALVGQDQAQIMLKEVAPEVPPLPNHRRHEQAPWDVFIYTPDPDALAQEFDKRKLPFHRELTTRDDDLRGFEIADPDGYVCFFGRPL